MTATRQLITIPSEETDDEQIESLLNWSCASCSQPFLEGDKVYIDEEIDDQVGCWHEKCLPTATTPTEAPPEMPVTKKSKAKRKTTAKKHPKPKPKPKPKKSSGVKRAVPQDKVSIVPTIQLLEKAYTSLLSLFEGATQGDGTKLKIKDAPRPVIVINSPGRRKNVLGHLAPKRWHNGADKGAVNELSVVSEYLERGAYAVIETLLHEMVHHFNACNDIKDVSGNQYHNKAFLRLATHAGIKVERMDVPKRGWASTSYTPELQKDVLKRVFKTNAKVKEWDKIFKLCHAGFPKKEKAPTKMKKWTCGCRPKPVILRAAVQINVTCNECEKKFRKDKEVMAAAAGLPTARFPLPRRGRADRKAVPHLPSMLMVKNCRSTKLTSMTTPPEQLPVETVALKSMSFEQRMIMLSWSLGLILVPLKLVGYTNLSWGEATFPLWGGTLLFIAWGLLSKAVRRG